MTNKFNNISTDADTTIMLNLETNFGEHDCVYQIWSFDNIKGSSLIFYKEDISDVSNEELENELRTSTLLTQKESKITFSTTENNEYLFMNFNFEIIE
ncbi:hypothetical protein [Algoriella sp.]|uniref:hypothetical protein n=1 Tax=Algoriella sp. TaxID=1872434 RepID=UPI001B2BA27A|nr:hypothetical protein [Algoriella sp.]MBO6213588.1 hypothetical protein [Algoriella sp.]